MSIRLMTRIWDSGAYSGGTLLVLLALADFAGDDGKRIFPHVETLAKKARLSIRATQLALETLRDDCVIRPVANATGGRGKTVEYEMDVERVQKVRPNEKGEESDGKGCNPEQERVQENTERVQSTTLHIEEPLEPSKNRQVEPPAASPPLIIRSKPDVEPPGFAEFYAAYPRKTGRRAAAAAYAKALKRAPGPTLLQGALRYAAERAHEDQNFTAHPKTWLNQDRWLDEPVSRETFSGGRHGGHQKPAHESFAADLMRSIHQDHGRQSSVPEGGGEIIDITPSGSETRDRDQAA